MDALLGVILGGFFCISGGFGSYGCYRCFTDRAKSRIHSEESSRRQMYNRQDRERHRGWAIFPGRKHKGNLSATSSTSSFNGTIYTLSSSSWRSMDDGTVPTDYLKNYALSINPQVISWTLQDEIYRGAVQNKDRVIKTAP